MTSDPLSASTSAPSGSRPGWSDATSIDPSDVSWLSSEGKPSILRDLREIFVDEFWAYRGLAYELTRRDIRVRYKQTVMGFGWAVLMPMLIVLSGALVRFAMAYVSGHHLATVEVAGIAVKAIPWSFFVGSMGFATASLVGNANLMTKIYFPREMLPLSATLAQSFDSTIGTTALLIVCPLLGVHFGLGLLWAPVLAACIFLFTAGCALLAGCANLFLRDVKYLVQVLLTFGIFFTPVFFEPYMFGRLGARVMMLNPLAPLLEGLRLSVVYNHQLLAPLVVTTAHGPVLAWSPWYLAYSVTCAVVMFFVGLLVFHRAENRFAEYV
jgi:homopolymeric O-antigen transport system permease protein